MTKWYYYPKSDEIPEHLREIVNIFEKNQKTIESPEQTLTSNEVLNAIREDLESIDFKVERKNDRIKVPVPFGENGKKEKVFYADAYNENTQTVIEVEAGRAFANNQFLKDLFQACMMINVKYLVTAVRNKYVTKNKNTGKETTSKDFEKVMIYYNILYESNRLILPLTGALIIGY